MVISLGAEPTYQMLGATYRLLCRLGSALLDRSMRRALALGLAKLSSPLTGEGG